MSDPATPAGAEVLGEQARVRTAAVWVLPVETGGCGACQQSIYALQASRYAGGLRTQGISFARSPHHADVLLLTGGLANGSRAGVEALLARVPMPRALVAVGDCALNGCVFHGGPLLDPSLAERLDVHIEVGGCPPPPSAVLAAIIEAQRLLAGVDWAEDLGEAPDAGGAGTTSDDATLADLSVEDGTAEEPTRSALPDVVLPDAGSTSGVVVPRAQTEDEYGPEGTGRGDDE